MKRLALILMAICLALPLTASAVTITFDEYPVGTLIGSQYFGDGVWFSNFDTPDLPVIAADGAIPTSPVLSGSPTYTGGFWMGFVTPQNHVSFDSGFWNSINTGFVRVQDTGSNTVAILTNTATGIYTFDLNYPDIKYITFSPQTDPGGADIDNLTFGAVPEPSALLLLGSGLVGLVTYHRRKRMKQAA